jgi:hypothetical protein
MDRMRNMHGREEEQIQNLNWKALVEEVNEKNLTWAEDKYSSGT